jgi:chromate transporter
MLQQSLPAIDTVPIAVLKASHSDEKPQRASLAALYLVFLKLGASSFGGGAASWVYRAVVEKARWLSEEEFLTCTALTYNMPGIKTANIAAYVGHRVRGSLGALAALVGLVTGPFFAVISLAAFYETFNSVPGLSLVMAGVAAAAVGLVVRTGIAAGRNSARKLLPATVMATTFVAVGVAGMPVIPVVLVLAPLSVIAALKSGAGQNAD